MATTHSHSKWVEENFQPKNYQGTVFVGFDCNALSPMTILIDKFLDTIDLSFFQRYYQSNSKTGGRPNLDFRIMLKIYMYALYNDISIRSLKNFYSLGSELSFLSQGIHHFPGRTVFSKFLNVLDNHIDDIFESTIKYLSDEAGLDLANLYCDGTVFEAHNNRHKIITDTNIRRSNKKWNAVLNDENSSAELKETASEKLRLNIEREKMLGELGRSSYGRTDKDCVIMKDKTGNFIAGYNVQFIEESRHGMIVYSYISNKNPDSAAFESMIHSMADMYVIERITMDTGYGTPEILGILDELGITPVVKALKNENATKKITDYSFNLSADMDMLICPEGQTLSRLRTNDKGITSFKAQNCSSCCRKKECCPKSKVKTVRINIDEYKLFKNAREIVESDSGKESYSHRGNKCESPNGFIKYNLNGKKLVMNGLERNNTIIKLYSILFNLRRLISIKSDSKN
jgi:transposase